ncbi:MAG: glycoside hydrolase family 20 zincin-like fold domain-containing protein [Candidatus Latescibacterota bacterium]|nr:glycoside hydrolase family 20 zincin-like fold domain-containing protein [Candidatus Latescibacterota bacterium]
MNNQQWLRHLLPLPHEIAITDRLERHPSEIAIRVIPEAGPLADQAAADLRQLFTEQADCTPDGDRFTIVLGIPTDQGRLADNPVDLARLQTLPNNNQAYLIQPVGQEQLLIAALDGRGLYYGARTLHQLLAATLSPERVLVPLVNIVDWPDFDERGLWNFPDEAAWIPWLSSLKLNYGKMAATHLAPVERGQPNSATIDRELMLKSRHRAFNYSPFILHLNFLHDCGLFRAYPELAGRGDGALTGRYFAHKEGNQHRAPCASQPVLVDILTEWMESIAAQDGLDISCWLSERPGQCGCTDCTAIGQFVLEARAFVKAWQRARQNYPELEIRLFLSTTTRERDWRVLAELPPEIKIERACATGLERVRHLPRDLFANPLYDRYAQDGRWIASYDVPIGVNGDVDTPEFKIPEHSAHRIRDYVEQLQERGYQGAYGMIAWATLARETNGFNIAALAEWAWHGDGRGTREFAVAWATREGLADPDRFAEWSELMGPVEFDVFDADFPVCYSQDRALEMVRHRQRPYLGEGMFRYYETPKAFDQKKAICTQALEFARVSEMDTAHSDAAPLPAGFACETIVIHTYIDLAHRIYQIAELLATNELSDPQGQKILREYLAALHQAGEDNVEAIRAWRADLGPEPWHHRVHDALKSTKRTVRETCRFVAERYLY